MPRYNRRGQELVLFVPAIADPENPTVAELGAAGVLELQDVIRAISGFNYTGEDLDAADMGSTWGKTIPGGDTAADSSLTIYEGDDDADPEVEAATAMPKGTNGFVVFAPRGTVAATDPVDVWPVRVKSNNPDKTADNATATRTIGYSIPDPPFIDTAVAA